MMEPYAHYPEEVQRYLVASQWTLISEEKAFVKRCATTGDDMGSRIVCVRIVERLMRLCFLYSNKFAPYSKWFGKAFSRLGVPEELQNALTRAVAADTILERETALVQAQVRVAEMHNASGLTDVGPIRVQLFIDRTRR